MRASIPTILLLALVVGPVLALESDQYYDFDRPLADAVDLLNAKVALEIDLALEEINRGPARHEASCADVVRRIAPHFRQFIFHEFELWVTNTPLIERVPGSLEEELAFRRSYLYHRTHFLDLGTKVPPSPTILVDGVRLGTDKLSHFFSEGYWYYRWYRQAVRSGHSAAEAEQRAIRRGIFAERTILGKLASGVFSVGDLEANYRGMLFFIGLCEGDEPALEKTAEGWRQARHLDFRDHVTPEWDESYLPPVYGRSRWKKVRPVLLEYCPLLADPRFVEQREGYATRDRETTTERRIDELIRAGKIREPLAFGLERNCPPPGEAISATAARGSPPAPR